MIDLSETLKDAYQPLVRFSLVMKDVPNFIKLEPSIKKKRRQRRK